jgi:hypothetical protein
MNQKVKTTCELRKTADEASIKSREMYLKEKRRNQGRRVRIPNSAN